MEQRSYLDWEPELSLDDVFKPQNSISSTYIEVDGDYVYWLELKTDGTYVIIRKSGSSTEEITPDEFNVRTRVHEYGGRPYTVKNNVVYFSNFSDHRIYKQDLNTNEITPLTPEKNPNGSTGMYAGYQVSPDNNWLIFVYEESIPDEENKNYIGYIDLRISEVQEAKILTKGHGYYAEPQLGTNGSIAWLAWDTRYMPWESTYLYFAQVNYDTMQLNTDPILVHGDLTTSIVSPCFNQNYLYFIADYENKEENDPKNWWNIYRYDIINKSIEAVTKSTTREYGSPLWVVNQQRLQISGEYLYGIYTEFDKMYVERIDLVNLRGKTLNLLDTQAFSNIVIDSDNKVIALAGFSNRAPCLIKISPNDDSFEIYYEIPHEISDFETSNPKHIEFLTKDNQKAYAYYYPPANGKYQPIEGELPPCRVLVHGGPTARVFGTFFVGRQYWTNSGYAILDINHRGSTGYGRKFRDELKRTWGVVDAEDVYYAVKYFQKEGYISERVAIAGGSAGGYAVQRGLTMYPKLFKAGASYYGIGNLFTLFEGMVTGHKFEAYYGVYLFGGMPDEVEDVYRDRSPVFHLDKLETPMIIFQGSDDRVVVPENSREMAKILEEKGIKTKYIEYEGESHGFRKLENQKDSLTEEMKFYKEVFTEK